MLIKGLYFKASVVSYIFFTFLQKVVFYAKKSGDMNGIPQKTRTVLFTLTLLVTTAYGSLSSRVNSVLSRKSQKNVQYSILIIEAKTGKKVYQHNANTTMIPASNMKLVVSAAALNNLGVNFEYETVVGMCDGTLIIEASGDPLLGDPVTSKKYGRGGNWPISNITGILKDKKVKKINDIVIDTSIFDDNRVHPSWPREQLNKWYACEVSGLNFYTNCIFISAKSRGNYVSLTTEPKTDYVKLVNKARAVTKSKNTIGAYRNSKSNHLIIKGNVKKAAGPFRVAIERPAGYFGYVLAENLISTGIKVDGNIIEKQMPLDRKCRKIASYKTPISEVILRCNRDSLGLAAESLAKTIAAHSNYCPNNKNGSWQVAEKVVSDYLAKLKVSPYEFKIDDASGLSRKNKLSANALVSVLEDVRKDRKKYQLIKNSLSVGGVSGTASRWFKESKYKSKLFIKTGYINGVRSYSGYCQTKKGEFIFSVITNKSNGYSRKAMNDILQAIIDEYDG